MWCQLHLLGAVHRVRVYRSRNISTQPMNAFGKAPACTSGPTLTGQTERFKLTGQARMPMPEKGWTNVVVRVQLKTVLKAKAEEEGCSIGELIEMGLAAIEVQREADKAQGSSGTEQQPPEPVSDHKERERPAPPVPRQVAPKPRPQRPTGTFVSAPRLPPERAPAPKTEPPPPTEPQQPATLTRQPEPQPEPLTRQAPERPPERSLAEMEREIDIKTGSGNQASLPEMERQIMADPNTPEDVKRALLRQLYKSRGITFH